MAKKGSTTAKAKVGAEEKFARFYFTLAIDFVLPDKPKINKLSGKRYAESEDVWFTECCESLASTIEGKLSAKYDGVVFKHYERNLKGKNVFTIYFVISKLQSFKETDIIFPRKGNIGFKIKVRPLSLAIKEIRSHLYNSLCYDYYISGLSLKFVTSRSFGFEMYFEGVIVVEHEFTADEIRDAEGVSNAIEQFSNDVVSAFEGSSFDLSPPRGKRRSADNRYVFTLSTTRVYGFGENDVYGDLTHIDCDMDAAKKSDMDIDNTKDAVDSCVFSIQSELSEISEIVLPADVYLISSNLNLVDQDDEVYGCVDELITD